MLITDGIFITPSFLESIDGEIIEVAAAENMNLPGFIAESVNAAGSELIAKIQSFSGYLVGVGANANHQSAVLNVLSTAIQRPRALLNQIPVTEPNPTRTAFRRWIQFYCLTEFYIAVSNRKIKDRYDAKAKRYELQKKRHWQNLRGNGFPIVTAPLPCPGALLEYNVGTWGSSNVAAVSGGSAPSPVTYDVSITWCSLPLYVSSANQGNAESAGSAVQTLVVGADQVISVNTTGLTPPNGMISTAIGSAQGIYSPMIATNWNVYVGLTGQTLYLQNNAPIPIATGSYTLSAAPTLSGFPQNAGQCANYDFSFLDVLWRA